MSLDVYLTIVVDVGGPEPETIYLYSDNITHNLNKMAEQAGIYKHLWRPDELHIEKADSLIEPLSKGLKMMREDPEMFYPFNPPNGWGNYNNLIDFVESYLEACRRYPNAAVHVSR